MVSVCGNVKGMYMQVNIPMIFDMEKGCIDTDKVTNLPPSLLPPVFATNVAMLYNSDTI